MTARSVTAGAAAPDADGAAWAACAHTDEPPWGAHIIEVAIREQNNRPKKDIDKSSGADRIASRVALGNPPE
jgi:hypothetical protein